MNSAGDKSRQDIENEAFQKVMYDDEIPDRPQGFGFGVRKSKIYGVQGMLKKEGYGNFHKVPMEVRNDFKAEISVLNRRNEVLEKQNKDLQGKVEEHSSMLKEMLDIVRSGKTSTHVLDATKLALRTTNPKVTDRDGVSG